MVDHRQPGGVARPCAARRAAAAGWWPRAAPASPLEPLLNLTFQCSSQPGGTAGAGAGAAPKPCLACNGGAGGSFPASAAGAACAVDSRSPAPSPADALAPTDEPTVLADRYYITIYYTIILYSYYYTYALILLY